MLGKRLWLYVFVVIISSYSVLGLVNTVNNVSCNMTADISSANGYGMKFVANRGATITNVEVWGNASPSMTRCIIGSNGTNILASGTIVGTNCALNYVVNAGDTYYVRADGNGSNSRNYYNAVCSYPMSNTDLTFIAGWGGSDTNPQGYNIKSITTSYDDSIMFNSPSDSGSKLLSTSNNLIVNVSNSMGGFINMTVYVYNSTGLFNYSFTTASSLLLNVSVPIVSGSYFYNVSAFNSSGKFNSTTNIVSFSYPSLNIFARDSTGSALSSFNISLKNLADNSTTNYSGVNSNQSFNVIGNRLYSYNVSASNYAINNGSFTASLVSYNTLNLTMLPFNSINITVRDESTGGLIYSSPNTSLTLVSSSGVVTSTVLNGTKLIQGLSSDSYVLTFTKTNYSNRKYYITVSDGSFQNVNAYLNNGTTVAFNFKSNSGASVSGVAFYVYTYVNGTSTLVQSDISDITGTIQVALEPNKYYSFFAMKNGYANNSFSVSQVLYSSYDVIMTSSNQNIVVPSASVYISPTSFFKGQNVNLNIQFVSQYSSLTNYTYVVSYPGGSTNGFGSNSHGQTFNNSFNLNNAVLNSVVNVYYSYTLSNGVIFSNNLSYPITYTLSNRTWATMGNSVDSVTGQDSVTGYYVGERVLIVVFISIILFGVGWSIGGAMAGLIFALVPILFFINAGFVPKQLWYVTLFFIVVYFISRGSDS